MKIGVLMVSAMLIVALFGIQGRVEQGNDDLGELEIITDKCSYAVGEPVKITFRNIGKGDIVWWEEGVPSSVPYVIFDEDGNLVFQIYFLLTVVYGLPPGAEYNTTWNQTYNAPGTPKGQQVPKGGYEIYAEGRIAQPGQNLTTSDSAWIWIGVPCGGSGPVADGGPDQTVYVGDVVQFDGSGSNARPFWETSTVDRHLVGVYTSIDLDSYGYPHISYQDQTNCRLKYARWTGSVWSIETVDEHDYCPFNYGDTSIALDSNNHVHIAYTFQRYDLPLKYAKWNGSAWSIETLDTRVGYTLSMALDSIDNPHIGYKSRNGLNYTKWTGSEWKTETVDSGDLGGWPSLALDTNDYPHISYADTTITIDADLKYAKWTGSKWSIETVDTAANVGRHNSLALDGKGYPHISYKSGPEYPDKLKYAKWTGSAWSIETVDPTPGAGYYSSIAIDKNDYPHIGYYGSPDDLRYAKWTGSSWTKVTVDSAGEVGEYTSLVLDSNDYPHISYYDHHHNYDLKYARWTGSTWGIETVDSGGLGWDTSIALDEFDNPRISYRDYVNEDLKYSKWSGSEWEIEFIDSVGRVGWHTSLALDTNNNPHISYRDYSNRNLKYAKWTGTIWDMETVDTMGDVGMYTSIALDSNGNPHTSYYDWTNKDLKYARWTGTTWIAETVDSEGTVGGTPSIALDSRDYPHIGYFGNSGLKYAKWTGSNWSIEMVDSLGYVGLYTSIALDSNDNPHVSYLDYTNKYLKYAKWTGSNWSIEIVDAKGEVGMYTSLSLDGDDNPHISYFDSTNKDLKYARWTGSSWNIETVDSFGGVGMYTSLALDRKDLPHISYFDNSYEKLKYARKVIGPLSYDWDFDDGSPHGTGASPTYIYHNPGVYNVTLVVTDKKGATDTDNCIITVVLRNQPPVANANGPYYVDEGAPVTLDGSGSGDPDNDTLQYRWDLDNDGTWETGWSSDPTTARGWMDNGTYIVVLQVKDAYNETDVDYATVYVGDLAPVAEFAWSPEPQNEGSPVQFTDMSLSFPDTITSWSWEFGDGGTSTDQNATHTYGDNGIYTVTLTVTDDDGSTDAVTQSVTIHNVAPIAEAGGDKEGFEVSTFTFDGSFTDPGILDTHTYEWDFDYDGVTFDVDATGQSVTHTWIDDFDGTVAMRVTDDDGGVGLDTALVLVKNVPPTVELTALPINVNVSLRIAGEKWHDVSIELYENGILIAQGNLTRYPGSPNDQMLDLTYLSVNISRKYSLIVRYTPEDDPVNGQPNGANPCWILLTFDDGEELRLHHNFNFNHPDRYVWEVDLVSAILSHGLTFEATAYDPGADDLAFHWSFGDGTNATSFYPNTNNTYPVQITETITHAFLSSGGFTVTLTVTDDDGGVGVATINIVIP